MMNVNIHFIKLVKNLKYNEIKIKKVSKLNMINIIIRDTTTTTEVNNKG